MKLDVNIYPCIYFRCRPSINKSVELITTEDELLLRQLSVYIHKAFLKRTKNIYVLQ